MRLSKDIRPSAFELRVACQHCEQAFQLGAGFADLDGKAFEAYICDPCYQKRFEYRDAPVKINGFTIEQLLKHRYCPFGHRLEYWNQAKAYFAEHPELRPA